MGALPPFAVAPELLPWLALTVARATLVLGSALLLATVLRRAPGSARHRLWSLAFAGLLVLPALALALPSLPLPVRVPEAWSSGMATAAGGPRTTRTTAAAADPEDAGAPVQGDGSLEATPLESFEAAAMGSFEATPVESFEATAMGSFEATATGSFEGPGSRRLADQVRTGAAGPAGGNAVRSSWLGGRPADVLFVLWLAGFAAAIMLLAASLGRGFAMVRRARPVADAAWLDDLEWHRNFFGIRRRVRLLESSLARAPMTGGLWRPVVIVPEGAAAWPAVLRRLVLLHELVHIRRHDVVRHLVARAGVALYWFHPLAWLAARSSAVAREQACDEEVVRLGVKPSVYASHLLELAEALGHGRVPAAALPMIQRSQLEKRLMTILDADSRPRAARVSTLAAALMVLISVSAGVAVPATTQQSPPAPVAPAAPAPTPDAVPEPATVPTPEPAAVPVPQSATVPAPEPGTAAATTPEAAAAPAAVAAPPATAQASACWPGGIDGMRGNFSGTFSSRTTDSGRRVDAVGQRDGDRIIQRHVDDLRLCMLVHGDVELEDGGARIGRVGEGGRVVLEAERDGSMQRLEIRNDGAGEQTTWSVNGAERAVDTAVERWRDQMTAVLAEYAAISELRGQRSSLRGQISSIRGQRSSLRGQISSTHGQRSSLRGQISSIHGQRSSLRGQISAASGHVSGLRGQISSAKGHASSLHGQISAARGHVSSLRGAISSHGGAISGLQSARYGADQETLATLEAAIRRHQEAIEEIERQIEAYDLDAHVAEIERQLEGYDLDALVDAIERQIEEYDLDARIAEIESLIAGEDVEGRVAEIERQIEALDVEGKVAEIERQIAALDVEGQVAELERRIEALNVDERVREIEERLEPRLRELLRLIGEIGV
jgi:beta-lactamase regulating signal transducer with metallopeptidase domain